MWHALRYLCFSLSACWWVVSRVRRPWELFYMPSLRWNKYAIDNNRSSVATLCLFGYIDCRGIFGDGGLASGFTCGCDAGSLAGYLVNVFKFLFLQSPLQPVKVFINTNFGHFHYLRLVILNESSLLFIFMLSWKDIQVVKIKLANSALKLIRVKLLTS